MNARNRVCDWISTFPMVLAMVLAACTNLHAINIVVKWDYDTNGFFDTGTTSGQQARAAMLAAADYFSGILDDTFAQIETPPPFYSQNFNGNVTWQWQHNFSNPASSSGTISLVDETIPADSYWIYAGGRSIPGNTLGIGGPGGVGWSSGGNGGGFSSGEIAQINQITDAFSDTVTTRGESSGFSNWGGFVTFDNDASADWHFDYTQPVPNGKNDFFSVAIHELGHALGLGTANEWDALVSGGTFLGTEARAANGNVYPSVTGGHWTEGTMSTVFGSTSPQEAAMDPTLTAGNRKLVTSLDAAALQDIGWTVAAPTGLPGDYNGNNMVDAADYTVWLDALGGGTLLNEGASLGTVDSADYDFWKLRFGDTLATTVTGIGSVNATIPEPSTLLLNSMALLSLFTRRIRLACVIV